MWTESVSISDLSDGPSATSPTNSDSSEQQNVMQVKIRKTNKTLDPLVESPLKLQSSSAASSNLLGKSVYTTGSTGRLKSFQLSDTFKKLENIQSKYTRKINPLQNDTSSASSNESSADKTNSAEPKKHVDLERKGSPATSGKSGELKVIFKAKEVMAYESELDVSVSSGKNINDQDNLHVSPEINLQLNESTPSSSRKQANTHTVLSAIDKYGHSNPILMKSGRPEQSSSEWAASKELSLKRSTQFSEQFEDLNKENNQCPVTKGKSRYLNSKPDEVISDLNTSVEEMSDVPEVLTNSQISLAGSALSVQSNSHSEQFFLTLANQKTSHVTADGRTETQSNMIYGNTPTFSQISSDAEAKSVKMKLKTVKSLNESISEDVKTLYDSETSVVDELPDKSQTTSKTSETNPKPFLQNIGTFEDLIGRVKPSQVSEVVAAKTVPVASTDDAETEDNDSQGKVLSTPTTNETKMQPSTPREISVKHTRKHKQYSNSNTSKSEVNGTVHNNLMRSVTKNVPKNSEDLSTETSKAEEDDESVIEEIIEDDGSIKELEYSTETWEGSSDGSERHSIPRSSDAGQSTIKTASNEPVGVQRKHTVRDRKQKRTADGQKQQSVGVQTNLRPRILMDDSNYRLPKTPPMLKMGHIPASFATNSSDALFSAASISSFVQLTSEAMKVTADQKPLELAFNEILKMQLTLTKRFIQTQYSMYKAYSTSAKNISAGYKPTTLEDTKKYIIKYKKRKRRQSKNK